MQSSHFLTGIAGRTGEPESGPHLAHAKTNSNLVYMYLTKSQLFEPHHLTRHRLEAGLDAVGVRKYH